MTDRGMEINSSEQVPGQQTNESTRAASDNESDASKGLGDGPHAGEGDRS